MTDPTHVQVPASAVSRVGPISFKVGERVTLKDGHYNPTVEAKYRTGTVAHVPAPDTLVLNVGNDTAGGIGVDLDGGGRAVAPPDHWEYVADANDEPAPPAEADPRESEAFKRFMQQDS